MNHVASILQIVGLLTVAGAVATLSLAAGAIVFGASLLLVGVALERR